MDRSSPENLPTLPMWQELTEWPAPLETRGLFMDADEQLLGRLDSRLAEIGLGENESVLRARELSLALHHKDKRTDGSYIRHILGVTLTLIERLHVRDPAMIAAALLHDSVEDHAKDIVRLFTDEEVEDEATERVQGLGLLHGYIGEEPAELVRVLSNPIVPHGTSAQEKNFIYGHHTYEIILASAKARVIKLADFIDNACGNNFTKQPKQLKLDVKYLPTYITHEYGLTLPGGLLDERAMDWARQELQQGYAAALVRIDHARRKAERAAKPPPLALRIVVGGISWFIENVLRTAKPDGTGTPTTPDQHGKTGQEAA